MGLGDGAGDSESESRAEAVWSLHESVEDPFGVLRTKPGARIAHLDDGQLLVSLRYRTRGHGDAAARRHGDLMAIGWTMIPRQRSHAS